MLVIMRESRLLRWMLARFRLKDPLPRRTYDEAITIAITKRIWMKRVQGRRITTVEWQTFPFREACIILLMSRNAADIYIYTCASAFIHHLDSMMKLILLNVLGCYHKCCHTCYHTCYECSLYPSRFNKVYSMALAWFT